MTERDIWKARWFCFTLPLRVRLSTQRECGCRVYRFGHHKTWAYCFPHLRAELEAMTSRARKDELRAMRKRAS